MERTLMTRKELENFCLTLYPEANGDKHWQRLIKYRACSHVRSKGFTVEVIHSPKTIECSYWVNK